MLVQDKFVRISGYVKLHDEKGNQLRLRDTLALQWPYQASHIYTAVHIWSPGYWSHRSSNQFVESSRVREIQLPIWYTKIIFWLYTQAWQHRHGSLLYHIIDCLPFGSILGQLYPQD